MFTATHLHAMMVHFPIALLLVGFLFEIIWLVGKRTFFQQASFYIILLAAVGAVFSYLTGDAAGDGMEGGSLEKAIEAHEQAATITLWLTIATATLRLAMEYFEKNLLWLRSVAFVLLLLSVASVVRTGYLGGQLVFKHAAGVEIGLGNAGGVQEENDSNRKLNSNAEEEEETKK